MFWIVKSACPNGTILFSFTKKNGVNASTELWTIHAPDSHEVLYSSWKPADNQTETRVECITKTSNLQYELVMTGMWKIPNYLEIQGLYGNRVFKGTYSASYMVSMLTLVDSDTEWHASQSYVDDWSRTIPSDWSEYSPPSPLQRSVYYFCSRFTGMSGMTAYEVQFLYRSGIVAYINGIEVYRDNLPLGMILPQTEATSGYASAEFRGTIRNAFEITCSDCVLAVEIHPLEEETVVFDAWLAVYSSSLPEEQGYPVPYVQVGINSYYYESYRSIADYDIRTGLEFPYHDADYYYVEFSGTTAQVNMWLISTYDPYFGLSRFKFSAKNLFTEEWSPLELSRTLNSQGSITEAVQIGGYSTYNSGLYRFYISEYLSYSFIATEIRPYITYHECDLKYILPEFEQSYKVVNGTETSITPLYWDQVTCLSIPSLPTGLKFDKCSIVGTPTIPQAAKTYSVYVYDEFGTKRKTFSLEIVRKSNVPVGIIVGIFISFCIICILVIVIILMLCPSHRTKVLPIMPTVNQSPAPSELAESVPQRYQNIRLNESSLALKHSDIILQNHHPDDSQHHSTHTRRSNTTLAAPRPPRSATAPPLTINYIGESSSQSTVVYVTEGTEDTHMVEPTPSQSCIVTLPTGDVVDVQTMDRDKRDEVLKNLHII